MDATDVMVIGAGPAGSSVALRLARAGHSVMMLERSAFPRTKVCGDYLCRGALDALRALGLADVLGGAHPIRSVVMSGFGAQARFTLTGGGAASLPRAVLDDRLLASARSAGVHVRRGAFIGVRGHRNAARVMYRNEHGHEREIESQVLVGADGAWSSVALRTGMVRARSRPAGPWAVGGELEGLNAGEELSMYIGSGGYYARNPLGRDTVNTMLVAAYPQRGHAAEALVEDLTQGAFRFSAERLRRIVAIGPLGYRTNRVAKGRVILTGDAAELLDPFTGQGVATALALSVPAAAAVHDLLRGRHDWLVEREYATHWRSIVGPRRALTRLVRMLVRNRWLRERAVKRLRRDPDAASAIVASVSGDGPAELGLSAANLWRMLAS